MALTRRALLKGAGALPMMAGNFAAFAATPVLASNAEIPPIVFVHGNGEQAALWITTLWRMESNDVPRERMFARACR